MGVPLQRAPKPVAACFYRPSRIAGTRTEGQEAKRCGRAEGILDTGYAKAAVLRFLKGTEAGRVKKSTVARRG